MTVRQARRSDRPAVIELLDAAGLPTAGIPSSMAAFLVAEDGGRVVGAIGLEAYGDSALLRSAVVEPGHRGTGVGRELVEELFAMARGHGARDLYLLTTTAEPYFRRFGFEPIDRERVPGPVLQSVEFREACPASAVVMRREESA